MEAFPFLKPVSPRNILIVDVTPLSLLRFSKNCFSWFGEGAKEIIPFTLNLLYLRIIGLRDYQQVSYLLPFCFRTASEKDLPRFSPRLWLLFFDYVCR